MGALNVNREALEAIDFEKGKGLVPVVVQDVDTGVVLMLAYADRDAVERTIETGFAHYYSRSRQKIWKKGETSGNLQRVVGVYVDCDGDAILYRVKQTGVACHTGEYTCFFRKVAGREDE